LAFFVDRKFFNRILSYLNCAIRFIKSIGTGSRHITKLSLIQSFNSSK
jgi:hypothetical protein